MKDLTETLLRVNALKDVWNEDRLSRLFARIGAALPDGTIDWEPGDESWARVFDGEQELAIVRIDAPLAFVIKSDPMAPRITEILLAEGIVVVNVDSWDEEEFTVSAPSALEALGMLWKDQPDATSLDAFSAGDLWYETISL